uniref:S15-ribonuclease n=1 Tax=Citrus tamurana TaxID=488172 RepID=A0A7U3R191_9ROSI|nr:S15-ribonuclease [Citrus tamurana]
MKNKAIYLFLLALFVTNCVAQNSSGFHHFWLVQVWPAGYCLQRKCARGSKKFIIHGLWPVNSTEHTLPGTGKTGSTILSSLNDNKPLQDDLMEYWLSLSTKDDDKLKNFWIYQWQAHGSAAQKFIKPLVYFRRAVDLTMYTDLLNTLNEAGILANGSSYKGDQYKKAIKAKTGYDPVLSCVLVDGHSHLKEVTICVDAQARNFILCGPYKRDTCRVRIKFPRPYD